MKRIKWVKDGWTTIQEADPIKHQLEINCRAENGTVVEVRIRHSRGEEQKGEVTRNGENVLPIDIKEFKTLYSNGELNFK